MLKLFLTKIVLLTLLIVACVTKYDGYGDAYQGLYTSEENRKALSPLSKFKKTSVYGSLIVKNVKKESLEIQNPKAFREYFCKSDNRPKRNISAKAKLPLLRVEQSPVDVNQTFQLRLREYFRSYVKNFFFNSSNLMISQDFGDYIENSENMKISYSGGLHNVESVESLFGKDHDAGNGWGVVFDYSKDRFYLTSDSFQRMTKRDVLTEIEAFINGYILLIPDTNRSFMSEADSQSCPIKISEAVQNQRSCWQKIMPYMTSIKEAPSENPRIINYDISLDLTLFCRFGRPVNDLLSK